MKKAVLAIVITSTILTGCAFSDIFVSKKVEPPTVSNKVIVDPKLLQSCSALQALPAEPTFEDIAANYITTIGMYGICRLKQEDSIKTIRKLANIEVKE